MSVQNRIKLAEAMGWTNIHMKYVAMDEKSYPFGCVPGNVNDKNLKEQVPDPFTNANDDYAVLAWLRNNEKYQFNDRLEYHLGLPRIGYQIGDYARAALKVITDTDQQESK